MISGGISENKDQNFKNLKEIIHVEGSNIKNQINYALVEGLKKENEIEFHFELGNNFFLKLQNLELLESYGIQSREKSFYKYFYF